MANTYTSLHIHFVFSTKNRHPWIHEEIEQRVWEYIGGIARDHEIVPIRIGGIEDHVHALVGVRPTITPSQAVQLIKGASSKWIHETFPRLADFAWQDGYGAFSVSKSNLAEVVQYIANQREHHRRRTFQEEYRALLERHGIVYDERYLWG